MATAAHPAMLPRRAKPAWSRLRITVRGLRLASGLVLLAYVTTHLLNHALGNVSLAAMERGLAWAAVVWWSAPGQAALYGAFAVHLGLGLWALYRRRPFRYRPAEAFQLGFGLLIPLLLAQHIVSTRLAFELHDINKGYAQILAAFFAETPAAGVQQAVTLVIVWAHGMLGLYLWLRLKPFYPRIAPLLLCVAVLLPVIALLGYVQGGRDLLRLYADPEWREANLGPDSVGTPEDILQLDRIRWAVTAGYVALVGLTILARGVRRLREQSQGRLSISYPDGRQVRVPGGTSILEASRLHGIPHASVCGGRGRCSTCRVRVIGPISQAGRPAAAERAVLERIGAGPGDRLACQFRPEGNVAIAPLLAPHVTPLQAGLQGASALGEEHFVVAMFVDMRGSTRLAERRLPYDTVFVINRFLEAVGRAVTASGGSPNQFLGDGMLALFGLRTGPAEAARQALEAVRRIAENVAVLNDHLAPNLDTPIRFGIGVHAGVAILGEIGGGQQAGSVFTAVGDPVNVASRLQSLTKRHGVEAIVSEAVFEAAALAPELPCEEVAIEGRDGVLWIRLLETAASAVRTKTVLAA